VCFLYIVFSLSCYISAVLLLNKKPLKQKKKCVFFHENQNGRVLMASYMTKPKILYLLYYYTIIVIVCCCMSSCKNTYLQKTAKIKILVVAFYLIFLFVPLYITMFIIIIPKTKYYVSYVSTVWLTPIKCSYK